MASRLFVLSLAGLLWAAPLLDACAEEPVPVFVANVDATRLAGNTHLSLVGLTDSRTSFLRQLGDQIRAQIKASPRLKLVEPSDSAPPEGMLVLVVSLGHADVVRWRTDLEGGGKLTELRFRLSAELQLVEPISGQVVYSDAGYFLSEEWDEQDRHYLARDFNSKTVARFREDPQDHNSLLKFVAGRSAGRSSSQEVFQGLIKRSLAKLAGDQRSRFQPLRVRGQVARILSAAKAEFVINCGRTVGLFEGMRLVSAKDNRVAKIIESFSDYAIARMQPEPGSAPVQWETFTAYQAVNGSPQAQALTSVTRIIFSDTFLAQPETSFLREDEKQLEAILHRTDKLAPLPVPIFQAVFAKHLTDQLAEGQKFRLGFPIAGLASLSRARTDLNNDYTRDWHPDVDQASAMPDYGITALISNLARARKMIPGGHEDRYEVTVSLCLYNFRNGEILCSAKSRGERTVREAEVGDLKALINESREAEVFNLVRGALKIAAEKLTERCHPENVRGLVETVDGNTLGLEFPSTAPLHAGQVLQLAAVEGEVSLTQQAHATTEFYRNLESGSVVLRGRDQNRWKAVRNDSGRPSTRPPAKGDKVLLYGLPRRIGVTGLSRLVSVSDAIVQPSATEVITPEDLRQLAFAVVNDEPRLRLLFDGPTRLRLRRFDKTKFLADNAFLLADGHEAEAQKYESDLLPDAFAYVTVDSAEVTKLSENLARKTKEVKLDFKVTLGLRDGEGKELFKPAAFTLNKTKTIPLDDPDGASAARQYLDDILTKLVDFVCEKRLAAVP